MTPPTTLVNTYVQVDRKLHIDVVSKIVIICGIPFGINRLPIFGINPILTAFLVLYSLGLASYWIYAYKLGSDIYVWDFVLGPPIFHWFFLMLFDLLSIRRLQRYYNELNTFDKEVACTAKMGKGTIRNILQAVFNILYMLIIFISPYFFTSFINMRLEFIPLVSCHIMEIYYIGHLLSLLIPRLRLITYYMELSLTNNKIIKTTNVKEFGFQSGEGNRALCKIEKLMNLYYIIVKSFNYLVDAVKWQLLVAMVTIFVSSLCNSYVISNALINNEGVTLFVVSYLALSVGIMLPLFAPCTIGDQLHNEVRRLRELLASRLYENQLDKVGRGIARALLAWTETRDLSFKLLRMLNIDISLPFKFVGLLVTYLIILLQFKKVINS